MNGEESEYESAEELEFELEAPEEELEFEAPEEELEFEAPEEELAFEAPTEEEIESERNFADRLYEAFSQSYESELELDERLGEVLNEMERDFFFGKLKKVWKKVGGAAKRFAKSKLGALVGKIPVVGRAIQIGTSLLRGDLKGALGGLMKSGLLKTALGLIPGVGPALAGSLPMIEGALRAAGVNLEVPDTDEGRRQFASDVAFVAREANDYLVQKFLDPKEKFNLSNPIQAKKLALRALVSALKKARARGKRSFRRRAGISAVEPSEAGEQTIMLQKGQVVKIIGR